MSNEFMIDVLAGVKAYIAAGLEAQITAIEAARSVTITRWKFLDYKLNRGNQYPGLAILPKATSREYGNPDAPLGYEHWNDHEVSIFVTAADADDQALFNLLGYYAQAIEALAVADWTFGARFNRVLLGGADWLAALAEDRDKRLVQTIEQVLLVRTFYGG